MGYVGLPLALSLADKGFRVIGIDINQEKINALAEGKLLFAQHEPGLQLLLKKVRALNRCQFTTSCQHFLPIDVFIITVQTPLRINSFMPDYRMLKKAIHSVAPIVAPNSLLVVQSTIAPGTSRKELYPMVEKLSNYRFGKNLFYAHVPERVTPGAMLATLTELPRIIGGDDDISREAARLLYAPITKGEIDLTDTVTAEVAKTAENSHRFMEINFSNALALTCEHYAASYQEVRRLTNKRSNVHLLQPGVGVGGHCIPKDPWLLVRNHSKSLLRKLFKNGHMVNHFMATHTVELVQRGLNMAGVKRRQARIAILGYSYREGSDDIRSSPAELVISKLKRAGIKFVVHDPLVKKYQGDLEAVLRGKDVALILTAHREYQKFPLSKMKKLLKHPVLIDGRQTWSRQSVMAHHFIHLQIGEPNECP